MEFGDFNIIPLQNLKPFKFVGVWNKQKHFYTSNTKFIS